MKTNCRLFTPFDLWKIQHIEVFKTKYASNECNRVIVTP